MKLGSLTFSNVSETLNLVAKPVAESIEDLGLKEVYVSEIDANLSDTAAFCEQYRVGLDVAANCVVVEAKRADKVWYAACVILATTRVDVNGIVRKYLDARKISFAPMDTAVTLSAMEYGGITPIGLPADWPILVDSAVARSEMVIIGSGMRKSKVFVAGSLLATLPNAVVMDITKSV